MTVTISQGYKADEPEPTPLTPPKKEKRATFEFNVTLTSECEKPMEFDDLLTTNFEGNGECKCELEFKMPNICPDCGGHILLKVPELHSCSEETAIAIVATLLGRKIVQLENRIDELQSQIKDMN